MVEDMEVQQNEGEFKLEIDVMLYEFGLFNSFYALVLRTLSLWYCLFVIRQEACLRLGEALGITFAHQFFEIDKYLQSTLF